MRRIIYLIVLACSLALALYLYVQYDQTKMRLSEANRRLAEQDTRQSVNGYPADSLNKLEPFSRDTSGMLTPESARFADELGSLSAADIERLRVKGLRNPETDLQNDLLRKQRTLIPAQGSLGGTMAIRDTRILNDRYAMAYFEDGHNGGFMVLRYEVQPGGSITWRVVDSYTL